MTPKIRTNPRHSHKRKGVVQPLKKNRKLKKVMDKKRPHTKRKMTNKVAVRAAPPRTMTRPLTRLEAIILLSSKSQRQTTLLNHQRLPSQPARHHRLHLRLKKARQKHSEHHNTPSFYSQLIHRTNSHCQCTFT